ncbi:hypothetical protein CYMTET_36784 [Cymbomonas tetramitiformis]|uniref:Uncharacterized protein n=1 Tax=Cymbomonas tetramitiformis TaxID=36881 RepID=A0AAE0F7A4_9CHLO|nr:hypothetical protein CYMTET_36784 [Cymbomonas tetramitiformis]
MQRYSRGQAWNSALHRRGLCALLRKAVGCRDVGEGRVPAVLPPLPPRGVHGNLGAPKARMVGTAEGCCAFRHTFATAAVIPPEEALHGLKESPEEPRSSEVAARHAEDIAEAILAASARDSIEGQLVWIGSEEVLLYVLFLLRDAGRRGFLSFLETFRWAHSPTDAAPAPADPADAGS